jgi:hypothetical protein
MLVDRMHTDAIRAADTFGIPQTVYRVGRDWYHIAAVVTDIHLSREATRGEKPAHMVVTWLPVNFFA